MAKYSSQQYAEVFYKLPQEIKDVIISTDTTEHIWKIGQKHNLHIDKIGELVDIAFDAMMGMVSAKNLVGEIQSQLGISALDASVLARDVDENVFKPIKATMISLYGDRAPNKPSSSLVQVTEEDEEHPHLDRDLLLKEIESPVIAKPRITQSTMPVTPEPAPKIESTKVIEEYHEEISRGTVIKEPLQPQTATSPLKEASKETTEVNSKVDKPSLDSLHKLADMKLSQSFVMPKDVSTPVEPLKPVAPEPAPSTNLKTPEPVRSNTNTPPQATKSYTNDPYREPII